MQSQKIKKYKINHIKYKDEQDNFKKQENVSNVKEEDDEFNLNDEHIINMIENKLMSKIESSNKKLRLK